MNHEHDDPASFTAGAVGEPGDRVFYLQSIEDGALVSLRLEKQQVRALAEYLDGLLADLSSEDETVPAPELVEPVISEWIVGNIGVAYDNDRHRVVIVAEELRADEEGEVVEGDQARFSLTPGQVRGFVERAETLMAGGRPPCPVCGMPMNADGHFCPRSN